MHMYNTRRQHLNDTRHPASRFSTLKSTHICPNFQAVNLFLLHTLPSVVPSLSRRVFCLHASVLNGEHVIEDTLLNLGLAEKLAAVTSTGAQLLAGSLHALELALQLHFLVVALLGLEELPGAVDGPVAEVTVTREAEGTGGKRVVEEVADESWSVCISDCSFGPGLSGLFRG